MLIGYIVTSAEVGKSTFPHFSVQCPSHPSIPTVQDFLRVRVEVKLKYLWSFTSRGQMSGQFSPFGTCPADGINHGHPSKQRQISRSDSDIGRCLGKLSSLCGRWLPLAVTSGDALVGILLQCYDYCLFLFYIGMR